MPSLETEHGTARRGNFPAQLSRSRSWALRWIGPVLVMAALASACSLFRSSGPTPVAQGKYYGSGHPEYDEFFLELYRAQVTMAEVPQQLGAEEVNLARQLGLGEGLPREAVIEHVRVRANEISKEGVIMKLQLKEAAVDKPSTAVLITRPATRTDPVRSFAEPIEKSAHTLLSVRSALEETTSRLKRLDSKLTTLKARTKDAFVRDGVAKVHDVERNLEDASRVLAYMSEQAEARLEETRRLLGGLAEALDTSGGAFDRPAGAPPSEVAEAEEPKKTPRRAPARRSSRPQSTPQAPPKKAPQPAPPPPRPASAPSGFEP